MLKLLATAPTDLGKRSEITKLSPTLDRATKDIADLRFYTSTDGKQTYLRVWEETPLPNGKGEARWYSVEAAPAEEVAAPTTKK